MANKLLLVIPPCFANRHLDFEIGFPVHLAFLGQAARSVGWLVDYLDMTLEEKGGNDAFAELERRLSDPLLAVVGISDHTIRTSLTTRAVAELVKSLRPRLKVVVGGVNATFMWRELMDGCTSIDFLLRGYAQHGLRGLLQSIEAGHHAPMPGLVERAENDLRAYAMAPISVADFAPPLLTGLGVERYLEWTRVYPLLTHTGCGFACNFCTSVMPGPYQNLEVSRPLEDIIAEMEAALALGFDQFFMSANIFTSKRDRSIALCHAMMTAGIPERATWVCMTRVEFVDDGLLSIMRKAGCSDIAFGVETAGVDQWKSLRKGRFSSSRISRAFGLSRDNGITTTAYLMLGHPDQTQEAVDATVSLMREIDPDYRVINFFQPFPGTPYWREAARFGLSEISPIEEWNFHEAPICRTLHLNKSELFGAATRLYLDRSECSGIQPSKDSLQFTADNMAVSTLPDEVQLALEGFAAGETLDRALDIVRSEHGYRGRLITLYWLSAAARNGAIQRIASIQQIPISSLPTHVEQAPVSPT